MRELERDRKSEGKRRKRQRELDGCTGKIERGFAFIDV